MQSGRSWIRLALLVLLVACKPPSGGSADPDGGSGNPDAGQNPGGDAGSGGEQVERSCATTFRYAPTKAVGTVAVAGQWDWSQRTPLEPAGDGTYAGSLELPPGVHAYKLVVDDEWIFDPAAGYRAYDGGIENSAVYVGDCREPRLSVDSFQASADGRVQARLRVERGSGAPAVAEGGVTAELLHDFERSPVQARLDGGTLGIDLEGLAPGKYTLEVRAADTAGTAAEPLALPFWIEAEPFDWRSPIYMVMIDRFRNGDPSNDPAPSEATPSADWQGGDLAGLTAAIEEGYFDELGVQALWLSPFPRNPEIAYREGDHTVAAYHGYWPIRAREVDPRFGTAEDLERMVKAAHARGIRVLMDYVINHIHEEHEYFQSNPEWFRTGCQCGTANCGWTERRLDCLFQPYLPDVNWQNPEAAERFVDDALWWLERFDLDGLRVDAVKHVEDLAIANLATRVHERLEQAGTEFFLLGETAMGWAGHSIEANRDEYDTISRYIGHFGLNGQFDFVLYHAAAYNVFAYDTFGLGHADFWARASLAQYPRDAIMTPYIGSHDSQRFISLAAQDPRAYNKWPEQGLPEVPPAEAYGRARVAFTWVLTQPGAPLLYYGDEYGEYGGSDPDNRHMWRPAPQRSAAEQQLYQVISRVGVARKQSRALRAGGYRTIVAEDDFLAYGRYTEDDLAVVVLNHADEPTTRSLSVDGFPFVPAGFTDAVAPEGGAVTVDGTLVTVTVPARGSVVLVP